MAGMKMPEPNPSIVISKVGPVGAPDFARSFTNSSTWYVSKEQEYLPETLQDATSLAVHNQDLLWEITSKSEDFLSFANEIKTTASNVPAYHWPPLEISGLIAFNDEEQLWKMLTGTKGETYITEKQDSLHVVCVSTIAVLCSECVRNPPSSARMADLASILWDAKKATESMAYYRGLIAHTHIKK